MDFGILNTCYGYFNLDRKVNLNYNPKYTYI